MFAQVCVCVLVCVVCEVRLQLWLKAGGQQQVCQEDTHRNHVLIYQSHSHACTTLEHTPTCADTPRAGANN